jgi:hypothetical protein
MNDIHEASNEGSFHYSNGSLEWKTYKNIAKQDLNDIWAPTKEADTATDLE